MYEMEMQKTWTFAGRKLTAHKILKTATVEQMAAGNWEIVPHIPHMDSTLIVPTNSGNIVVDMLGRGKVLLETSPRAYKMLLELRGELNARMDEEIAASYAQLDARIENWTKANIE